MVATTRERYAVVSCHVERPLDDAVWSRFSALQEQRPGGFAIAALMRPADPAFGEDERVWVARAREAAARGPLGHHTHWTAPDHARPSAALVTDRHKALSSGVSRPGEALVTIGYKETGGRVLEEGAWMRRAELRPTHFCGGGWYTDTDVAEACAELGYVDCTPRASRPAYLAHGERWASLAAPAVVELPSGRELRAIPTTHSLGDLARALRQRSLPELIHVYIHDTDLLDARRRVLLRAVLPVLARRARAADLDSLAAQLPPDAPRVEWDDVTRH